MPHPDPQGACRDLVTAYLLALAGMPFTLRRDAAGRPQALQAPSQPRAPRSVN
jgi:hypothetical protein